MRFDVDALLRLWSEPLPASDEEAAAAFRERYTDPVTVNGAELTAADPRRPGACGAGHVRPP